MTRYSLPTGQAATHYGPRSIDAKHPSQYTTNHGERVQVVTFGYDDLPAAGTDVAILSIPANSYIASATLRVIDAFAGGTSYDIGLSESDGTVIDADGIDAAVATAAINAVGETVACDGALVGNTAGIGAAAGQVTVAATGTFTAGKAELSVTYKPLNARA